jgi:multiple sugar transport system permease protein
MERSFRKAGAFITDRDRGRRIALLSGRGAKGLMMYLFLAGLSFVMLYPVLFMLSSAFKSIADVYDPTVIWVPKNFSFQALDLAVTALDFNNALWRTVQITVPSVLLQVASTLITAYGFARFRFRGRSLLFGLLLFTMIVPEPTYGMPLFMNFRNFTWFGLGNFAGLFTGEALSVNLLNQDITFYLRAAMGSGIRAGLYIFIIRQFFVNMPTELEDAAMIDGCGPLRTFTRVMVPNVTPAIVTVTMFSLVWYWNDYHNSVTFFRSSFPLPVSLTMVNSTLSVVGQSPAAGVTSTELWLLRDPVMACACLLTILPLLVVYLVAQKFFTESIERTGIVG